MTSDISITSNNGFEISLTDVEQNYTNSLTINHSGGTISSTTISQSEANGQVNGILAHTSTGATTRNIAVTGTEYFEFTPEINFSFSSRSIGEVELFALRQPVTLMVQDGLLIM